MQMLTMLEGAVKRDHLSSNFETTTELLNSNTQDTNQNSVARSGSAGSATVLPWVPDTTAAVALRLLDLDSSISYTFHPKVASNKDREAGDFTVSHICLLLHLKTVVVFSSHVGILMHLIFHIWINEIKCWSLC